MKKEEYKNVVHVKELKSIPEYDDHFLVIRLNNKKAKLEGYIAIHRKNNRLPSFGATRLWNYKTNKDALKDSLRLAKLMSYKSALAGLPYGGAKAVIMKPVGKFSREKLLEAYALELNKLKGIFVTGTDVGLSVQDLEYMKKYTKYLVGYKANPEKATALGVKKSLDSALEHLYKNKKYSDYSYSIQGVGKVGMELLKILVGNGVRNIYIADIDKEKIKEIIEKYPFVKSVDTNKIHCQNVDIYSPCAMSGALNKKTINDLKCKIVVGSANNQLSDMIIGQELHKKGILYCPDYIANGGGLISVTDEYIYKNIDEKRLNKKVNKISTILKKIFDESIKKDLPPFIVSGDIGLSIINKNSLK
ncbi:MAG: Glu/Leu/Phe/Val dehydrogenase dimerization domain-containing protein [Candidatus Nomurabacteria bacterium]